MEKLSREHLHDILTRLQIVERTIELAIGQTQLDHYPTHARSASHNLYALAKELDDDPDHLAHQERLRLPALTASDNPPPGTSDHLPASDDGL